MYGYIYLTTNIVNGKIYIGQKKSEKFLGESYLGSGKHLKHSINKYGRDKFTVIQIDSADNPKELDDKEIYWIKYYNSTDINIGYNISTGGYVNRTMVGIHNPRYGKRWSDEWKQKHSQKMTEVYKGHPEKNPMYGKKSAVKNTHWYTNGVDEIMAYDCPEGYYRGRSPEAKNNISINTTVAMKNFCNKHWYTNGTDNILDINCPDGYYEGITRNTNYHPNAALGKVWINNQIIEKYIDKSKPIPDGYVLGRLKRK